LWPKRAPAVARISGLAYSDGVVNQSDLLKELRIDRTAPPAPPGRGRLWVLVGVVLVLGALVLLYVLGRTPEPRVKVAAAEAAGAARGAASVLDATGYVVARREATVSAKITGKVREVRIEEGQHVEAGQVLATLDDVDARAALSVVEAELAATRSQAAEIRTNLGNAEREYDRQQGLADRKLTSLQALDTARTQAEALRARLASQLETEKVALEQLAQARVQLDNTIIRAPFSGVITVKAAQPGEIVSPLSAGGGFTRTGIGTIVDMDSLEIEVDVNESYINRVAPGQRVEAVLNAYPDWKIPASVIAIIPTADRAKATVKVRIALGQKDARIVPEMGVRVSFLEDAKPPDAAATARAVLVPQGALRQDGAQDVVFVVRDGSVRRRAVSAGASVGALREIRAGLTAGDLVVVDGPPDLKDGSRVTLEEAPK
jgi:RND family efflux transporter MFP subunit